MADFCARVCHPDRGPVLQPLWGRPAGHPQSQAERKVLEEVPKVLKETTTKTRNRESTKRDGLWSKQEMIELNERAILNDNKSHPLEDLSRRIIGAAIEVHAALGPGFLETIYEEAFKLELREHRPSYEC
jgi:hypothetical protein